MISIDYCYICVNYTYILQFPRNFGILKRTLIKKLKKPPKLKFLKNVWSKNKCNI